MYIPIHIHIYILMKVIYIMRVNIYFILYVIYDVRYIHNVSINVIYVRQSKYMY